MLINGLITANPIHAIKGQSQAKKKQDDPAFNLPALAHRVKLLAAKGTDQQVDRPASFWCWSMTGTMETWVSSRS